MKAILKSIAGPPLVAAEGSPIDEARRGSMAAIGVIYDQQHRRVRQLARRLLGDDASAEDLVQEIFERLPRALRGFRGEAALETFLFSMVVNRVNHHLRGAVRRRRALQRLAGDPSLGGGGGSGINLDSDVHARELAAALVAALDRLPLAQRVAFVLCEVQELTAGEAAALTDVPEATVRTRVFHARRQLRQLMRSEPTTGKRLP
jgi:RNA polymerase sigma-70 factor, ECF subfamily